MTNYEKLSDKAKQIYGNVEDAMQDAEEMEGVSGMDYLNLMQEIEGYLDEVEYETNCEINQEMAQKYGEPQEEY
jgi:hypothetical protein